MDEELTEVTALAEVAPNTPIVPEIIPEESSKIVCDCHFLSKKDIGPTQNEEMLMYHIYICPHHKSIMKHHILTGEVLC